LQQYRIQADWDPEAKVWTATSADVPGLVVEADTLDALVDEAKLLIPDLLELNCGLRGPMDVSLVVTVRREERIVIPAA
jgi:hypothetical protein